MSQHYPTSRRAISSIALVIIAILISSSSALAVSPMNFCFVLFQSVKNRDFNAPGDYLKGMALRSKVLEFQRNKSDPMELITDQVHIFNDDDIEVLSSMSPSARESVFDHASYFFSTKQLQSMRKASWFTRDEVGDYTRVLRVQKKIKRQLDKFNKMAAGFPFFESAPDKSKGHWYVFDFIQETADNVNDPLVFMENYIEKAVTADGSSELKDAKFQFLLNYFSDKLAANDVDSLATAYQNQMSLSLNRNSLTILSGHRTLH